MATNDPIDAATELERLPDWGRGSVSREEIGRWWRRLRRVEVWVGVDDVFRRCSRRRKTSTGTATAGASP